MTQRDYEKFCAIVVGFAELKGRQLSPAAIELYWRAMQGWDIRDFGAAAELLLRSCQFMPTPKEFEDLRRAQLPTAAEAFARAVKHAASSAYRDGDLGDAAIDAAVRGLGGYVVIARTDTDKLPFLERRFAEHYRDVREARETREALPALPSSRVTQALEQLTAVRRLPS